MNVDNRYLELLFLRNINKFGPVKINSDYLQLARRMALDELFDYVCKYEIKVSKEDVIHAREKAKSIYDKVLADSNIEVITALDDKYPKSLKDMKSRKPVILYAKGNTDCLSTRCVSIVGTRNPSERTLGVGNKIVETVVKYSNATIISGLAIGCDKIAHETSLNCNAHTIAVLPSGFDEITPAKHKGLTQEIIAQGGCLVSEYEPNTVAQKSQFVRRDSIISALSDSVVVLECGINSGTMHTVEEAIKLDRPIACFYPDNAPASFVGCRYIINELGQYRITSPANIKSFLDMNFEKELTIFDL